VCASWLSISIEADRPDNNSNSELTSVVQDTTITSEIDREQNDDSDYDSYTPSNDQSYGTFFFPPVPDIDATFPPPTGHDSYSYHFDSIPGFRYVPGGDWETFEREFTEKFKDEFGAFFDKNQDQFEKMMKELREQHGDAGFMLHDMDLPSQDALNALQGQMDLLKPTLENIQNLANEDAFRLQEQALRFSEQALIDADWARTHADVALMEADLLRDHESMLHEQERMLRGQEERLKAYESSLKAQLIEDGYLDKDEKIADIHVNNGEVTVNGRKVKEEDQKKYQAIIDRFNEGWHTPRRAE
jgi:hypothetical protein